MSDLKFSCPACGQHIQCDASHAGENLPCPACAHIVRAPADAGILVKLPPAVTNSASPAAEEKASYASAGPVEEDADEPVPTLEENFLADSGTPTPGSHPLTEREEQIAAARKAHALQLTPPIKPRLSFILSGGAAPPPEENESAVQNGHKDSDHPSSETKSLNE
jgi:hypothetical protein